MDGSVLLSRRRLVSEVGDDGLGETEGCRAGSVGGNGTFGLDGK